MRKTSEQRRIPGATRSRRLAALDGLDAASRIDLLAEIETVVGGRVRDIVLTGRLRGL